MRPLCLKGLFLFFLAAAVQAQTPTITNVENAATNIVPGLPNSGIAQGSMFVVKGSNLGPSSVVIATQFPLTTTQAGTSVQITVGGQTVNGIMYYTLASQIAAILPSSTPTGTGTLTVTYNGAVSAPAPITVVSNNIGIFTVSTAGIGDAIATLADNSLVSPTNAPNPGDTVVLWGTGLGPVTGDETKPAQGGNMSNVPLQVFVGGQQATILYQGRNACCSSVDTIYVTIPAGVTTGCAVSVIMQIGTLVSNSTTIPIAPSGRTCTPTNPVLTQIILTQLLAKGSPLALGGITLTRTLSTTTVPGPLGSLLGTTTKSDAGSGRFVAYNAPASAVLDSPATEVLAYGSCTVVSFAGTSTDPLATLQPQYLDAGTSLAVVGPNGNQSIARTGTNGVILYNQRFDSNATYLVSGLYDISGAGGVDVALFTLDLNVPTQLNWTNQTQISTVTRSQGVTVNWDPTTGDPNGYVYVVGTSTSGTSAADTVSAQFTCSAPTTAGTFTVPPHVLLALPTTVSVSGFTIPGTLAVYGNASPAAFQADGLDFGSATDTVIISNSVTYE